MRVRCANCPMGTVDRLYIGQQREAIGASDAVAHQAMCLVADVARRAVKGACPAEGNLDGTPNPACTQQAAGHLVSLMRLHEQGSSYGLDLARIAPQDRFALEEQGLLQRESALVTTSGPISLFQE